MPQPADVSSARPRRFGRASVGALSSEKFTWDQVVKAEKAWGVDAVNWLGGTWTVRLPDP